jgi:hypothetical protein
VSPADLGSLVRRLSPRARPADQTTAAADGAAEDERARLALQRERLTERFAVMQSELGGLFYEMAIRDHVNLEVLVGRAAALQRVDTELAQIEHLLAQGHVAAGGSCPACGAPYAPGAAFCAQCAAALPG